MLATEADLYAAELESGAHLSQATFELCELRRCELHDVRGIEALRGARIPLADLLPITPLLAGALGIVPTD